MFRRIVAILLTLNIICSMSLIASAKAFNEGVTIQEAQAIDNQVRDLLKRRLSLCMEEILAPEGDVNTMSLRIDEHAEEIAQIDAQLEMLGVQKVEPEDIPFVTGETISTKAIEVPESDVNDWYQVPITVTYGGKTYRTVSLYAQPKSTASDLLHTGSKTIHEAPGVGAAACGLLSIGANAAIGATVVGNIALTVYDVFSTITSSMSTTTIIEDISVTYNWQVATTMCYRYVIDASLNADPIHCFTFNEVDSLVFTLANDITFNGTVELGFSAEETEATLMVENAALITNAIDSYENYMRLMHCLVNRVDLEGANDAAVQTITVWNRPEPAFLDQ